ncbi:hypothetical protein [Frankia sp. AvcI1]|uniref:hypothetical protein n=1 Tax=Frankia sp. AvcI1 TaxID=573496 RepID=UPI0021179D0C|nr:hypothetical protein [Frankia sp. AvcI1]
MDPTVLGAIVTGIATVVVTVLGLGATRQAARRADDLDRLRALADRQDAVITQRDAEIRELRVRIRELEDEEP